MSPKFTRVPQAPADESGIGGLWDGLVASADPALVSVILAGVVIDAIAVAALVIVWRRRRRAARAASRNPPAPRPVWRGAAAPAGCRWKRDRRRTGGALDRWVCARCGVEAFTSDGHPPKECKRALRDAAL